ncbi:MAG: 3-deoxy-D-manno-octulosonic acid transferase [Candidatus Omnitrophota bacterium]
MSLVYDLIFLVFALVSLPVYLFRRKFHRGFIRRLGILPRNLKLNRPIWLHAVSVGEAATIKSLLEELRSAFPARQFVISTVTPTGNKIAARLAGEGDFVTYLPLDLSLIVKRVIRIINPSLFIIAETEIWPNLISTLHAANIAVVTVNGRISERSLRGYLAARFLLKPIFERVSLFCMQSETDAARLSQLGVPGDKIKITGNMKFDTAGLTIEAEQLIRCRRVLKLGPADKLLVCGSTHRGEEAELLQVYSRLQRSFSGLKLLIAPRHPERAGEIESLAVKHGFKPALISRLAPESLKRESVFILDSVGELMNYYAVADIAFVGGSLVNKGGHNILEPAFLERPILFGPHMSNFRDIAGMFLKNNAAIMVDNPGQLEKEIGALLGNPEGAVELGGRARQVCFSNQGASARNAQYLRQFCGIIG